MILAIAIISLIGTIFSMFEFAQKGEFSADICITVIAILSWWKVSVAVSIIIICLVVLMMIIGAARTRR